MKLPSFYPLFLSLVIAFGSLRGAPMKGFLPLEEANNSERRERQAVDSRTSVERGEVVNQSSSSSDRGDNMVGMVETAAMAEQEVYPDDTMMLDVSSSSSSTGLGKRGRGADSPVREEELGKRARNEASSVQESSEPVALEETAMLLPQQGEPAAIGHVIPTLKQLAVEAVKRLHPFDPSFNNTPNAKEVIYTEHVMPWLLRFQEQEKRLNALKNSVLSPNPTISEHLVMGLIAQLAMNKKMAANMFQQRSYSMLLKHIPLSREVLGDIDEEIRLLEKNKKARQQAEELQNEHKESLAGWSETMSALWELAAVAAQKVVEAESQVTCAQEFRTPTYDYWVYQADSAKKELQSWVSVTELGEEYGKVLSTLSPALQAEGKSLLDQYQLTITFKIAVLNKIPGRVSLSDDDQLYRADESAADNDLQTFQNFLNSHEVFLPLNHFIHAMHFAIKAVYAVRTGRMDNISYYKQAADMHRDLGNVMMAEHSTIRPLKPLLIELYNKLITIDGKMMEALNMKDDLTILINSNKNEDGSSNEKALLYGVVLDDINRVLNMREQAVEELLHGNRVLSQELMRIAAILQALATTEQERVPRVTRIFSGITPDIFLNGTAVERQRIAHLEGALQLLNTDANSDPAIVSLPWNFMKTCKENLDGLTQEPQPLL